MDSDLQVDDAVAARFVDIFSGTGGVEVDTARIYSGGVRALSCVPLGSLTLSFHA